MTDSNNHPETVVIINCVLNVPLMILSVIGNSVVLAAVLKTSSLHSPSLIFLCSLAVSDLLVGLVVQPVYIAYELTKFGFLYQPMTTMAATAVGASLSTMTAISVDRFLALHYHMKYTTLVTTLRTRYTVGMIWLTNLLLTSFYFINVSTYHFMIATITAICIITSSFTYICIFRIVRRHQLQIHSQQQAVGTSIAGNGINMIRLQRSVINTSLFYIFLIICYFPMYVMLTINLSNRAIWKKDWNFSVTLVFMNSSINPLLFC